MNPVTISGGTDGSGRRIGVVASRFNREIVEGLLQGSLEVLADAGVADPDVTVVWVPGSLELPLAAKELITGGKVEGVIALGCVIRGETSHFEQVSRESVGGLSRVAHDTGIPVAVGVLTVENREQARIRAGLEPDPGNAKEAGDRHRGREAALACLEMINVLGSLRERA